MGILDPVGLTLAQAQGSFAPRGAVEATAGGGTVSPRFARRVLAANATGDRYVSFPSIVTTRAGKLVVVMRIAGQHNSGPGMRGQLWRIVSSDAGRTWTSPELVYNENTYDVRDPCLSRFGDEQRIYCVFHKTGPVPSTTQVGAYLMWSDDDCATWSAPVAVLTVAANGGNVVAAGAPMQKRLDGTGYFITGQRDPGNNIRVNVLFTATSPAGPWAASDAYAPTSGSGATEWHVAQLTATHWVGATRRSFPDAALTIVQTTNGGTTWTSQPLNDGRIAEGIGWPRMLLHDDGTLFCMYRGSGAGMRVIRCAVTDSPLVQTNWETVAGHPSAGFDTSLQNPGKLEWARVGDTYKAVYYGEPSEDAGTQTIAEVRFAEWDLSSFRGHKLYDDTVVPVNTASTTYQAISTIYVRSLGEYWTFEMQCEDYSAATVENFNIHFIVDDVQQTGEGEITGAASAHSSANSRYQHNTRRSAFLTPGLHKVQVGARVATGTQARNFRAMRFAVRPSATGA